MKKSVPPYRAVATSIPVVITTADKGIFFGDIKPEDRDKEVIRVENCQMCVYWTGAKTVLSLAITGPNAQCKIGPPAVAMTLQGVRSVVEATSVAVAAWKQQPWAK